MLILRKIALFLLLCCIISSCFAQQELFTKPKIVNVAEGWAKNSVNAVIFRHNSLTTFKDTQFIAFYNNDQQLVLGKRKTGAAKWQLKVTPYKGDATDAHRAISIIADGKGYLHISWDHHGNALNYCKSIKPYSLELTDRLPMTGIKENKVTYPEFYDLPDGGLLFLYRDGASGNGDLLLNRYDVKTQKWEQVQSNLISGEGRRNAYWQMATDKLGTIHLSWVWRESPDVASNHDMCYAQSNDGGKTWQKSTGEKYTLPITIATAEYAARIPQKSELINTTSIVADDTGHPYIATYWKDAGTDIPQYHIIYNNGIKWITTQITDRKTPFTLSGSGTKRIPIWRPVLIIADKAGTQKAVMIYRDDERGDKVTAAVCTDLQSNNKWVIKDLTNESTGLWEPSYDTQLWKQKGIVSLFLQRVEQGDGEKLKDIAPQMISVLEFKF